jgi:hypothetical protein
LPQAEPSPIASEEASEWVVKDELPGDDDEGAKLEGSDTDVESEAKVLEDMLQEMGEHVKDEGVEP